MQEDRVKKQTRGFNYESVLVQSQGLYLDRLTCLLIPAHICMNVLNVKSAELETVPPHPFKRTFQIRIST